MKYLLIVLIVCLARSFNKVQALTCYDCMDASSPSECLNTVECDSRPGSPSAECIYGSYGYSHTPGKYYMAKCTYNNRCNNACSSLSALFIDCSLKCCQEDNCNRIEETSRDPEAIKQKRDFAETRMRDQDLILKHLHVA